MALCVWWDAVWGDGEKRGAQIVSAAPNPSHQTAPDRSMGMRLANPPPSRTTSLGAVENRHHQKYQDLDA